MKELADGNQWNPVKSFTDSTQEEDGFTEANFETILQILANRDKYNRELTEKLLVSGTRLAFVQAAAPTGWTKVTGMEGRGLRLTDGAGGGVAGTSDAFGPHVHSVGAHGHGNTLYAIGHTLTISEIPSHTHKLPANSNDGTGDTYIADSNGGGVAKIAYTESTGGNQAHVHNIGGSISNSSAFNTSSFAPKYINAIVCQKD